MDFLRSYFFKNGPLISWAFLSSKLDSFVIKTLEKHSLNVKKWLLKKSILYSSLSNSILRIGELQKSSPDRYGLWVVCKGVEYLLSCLGRATKSTVNSISAQTSQQMYKS